MAYSKNLLHVAKTKLAYMISKRKRSCNSNGKSVFLLTCVSIDVLYQLNIKELQSVLSTFLQ